MKRFVYEKDEITFVATQLEEELFELKAYEGSREIWSAPNRIYTLRDCSTNIRMYLKAKGLRIKWVEVFVEPNIDVEDETKTFEEFLSKQSRTYLKERFDELEAFRKDGILNSNEIRTLNKEYFAGNTTTLFTIGENIYREIAKRHFANVASEQVTVTCYGQTKVYDSVEAAKEEYLIAIANCEGAERERYVNIYVQLEAGYKECSDEL